MAKAHGKARVWSFAAAVWLVVIAGVGLCPCPTAAQALDCQLKISLKDPASPPASDARYLTLREVEVFDRSGRVLPLGASMEATTSSSIEGNSDGFGAPRCFDGVIPTIRDGGASFQGCHTALDDADPTLTIRLACDASGAPDASRLVVYNRRSLTTAWDERILGFKAEALGQGGSVLQTFLFAGTQDVYSFGIGAAPNGGTLDVDSEYVGCYQDDAYRILKTMLYDSADGTMTLEKCRELAVAAGLTYYATQVRFQCFGGAAVREDAQLLASTACSSSCDGNGNQTCGNDWISSVFRAAPSDGAICTLVVDYRSPASSLPLNLDEVMLFATDGTQIPADQLSYAMSSSLDGNSVGGCFDGNTNHSYGAGCHTLNRLSGDRSPSLTVQFRCADVVSSGRVLSRIEVYNRKSCCGARVTDFRLRVLTPSGGVAGTYQFNSAQPFYNLTLAQGISCGASEEAVDGFCVPTCASGYARADDTRACEADCRGLQETYGIVPGSSWGTLTDASLMALWDSSLCSSKICGIFKGKYGATSGSNLGSMPDDLKPSWSYERPLENGGPATCDDMADEAFSPPAGSSETQNLVNYGMRCPGTSHVTAILMHSGSWIDAVGPVNCSDGSTVGETYGKVDGGSVIWDNAPQGYVGVTLGAVPSTLSMVWPVRADGSVSEYGPPPDELDAGNTYKTQACPAGEVVSGVFGRYMSEGTGGSAWVVSVGLVCRAPVSQDAPVSAVRLAGGGTQYEGRVEVQRGGWWGTVCGAGFNDNAVKVVCRMLGLTGGTAVPPARFGPSLELTTSIGGVSCATGDEDSLAACSYSSTPTDCLEGSDAGASCDVHACTITPPVCGGHGNCSHTTSGDYQCTCSPGWIFDGVTCADVNECTSNPTVCGANGVCSNSVGGYSCSCRVGWRFNGVTCVDVNECTSTHPVCAGHGVCSNNVGGYSCSCAAGWTFNNVTCVDVNECAGSPAVCGVHGACTNTAGGYSCSCSPGWGFDSVTCVDVDDCTLNPPVCGGHGNCTNSVGGYSCVCAVGWSYNGVTCIDVDECAEGSHDCSPSAVCSNTVGSFECACALGFQGDGHTCDDVPLAGCDSVAGNSYCIGCSVAMGRHSVCVAAGQQCQLGGQAVRICGDLLGGANTTDTSAGGCPPRWSEYDVTFFFREALGSVPSTDPAEVGRCNATDAEEVRLVGGANANEGRVEVKIGGWWGTVCNDTFDDNAAKVVCGMLGQPGGVVVYPGGDQSYSPGDPSIPILLDETVCGGAEGSLTSCAVAYENDCTHSEDVGVKCGTRPPPFNASMCPAPKAAPNSINMIVFDQADAGNEQLQQPCWDSMLDDLVMEGNGFYSIDTPGMALTYRTLEAGAKASDSMYIVHSAGAGATVKALELFRATATDQVIATIRVNFTNGEVMEVGKPWTRDYVSVGILSLAPGERLAEVRLWMTAAQDSKGRPQFSGAYFKTTFGVTGRPGTTVDAKPPGLLDVLNPDLLLNTHEEGENSRGSGILLGLAAMSSLSKNKEPTSINQLAFIFFKMPTFVGLNVDVPRFDPSVAEIRPVMTHTNAIHAAPETSVGAECARFTFDLQTSISATTTAGDVRGFMEAISFDTELKGGAGKPSLQVNDWDVTSQIEVQLTKDGLLSDREQRVDIVMMATLLREKEVNTTVKDVDTGKATFVIPPGHTGQCITSYSTSRLVVPYTATLTLAFDDTGVAVWRGTWSGTYTGAATSTATHIIVIRNTTTGNQLSRAGSWEAASPGLMAYETPAPLVTAGGGGRAEAELERRLQQQGRSLLQSNLNVSECCRKAKRAVSFKPFKTGLDKPPAFSTDANASCSCTLSNVTEPLLLSIAESSADGMVRAAAPRCRPPTPASVLSFRASGAAPIQFYWMLSGGGLKSPIVRPGSMVTVAIGEANTSNSDIFADNMYRVQLSGLDSRKKLAMKTATLVVPPCRALEPNECVPGAANLNCHVHASCSKGTFRCTCNDGYAGDGLNCTDVDECAAASGPCHPNATCANAVGGYNCTCKAGFDGDGRNCTGLCAKLSDCTASKYGAMCDAAEGRCRACLTSADCPNPATAPYCRLADNACKPCANDTQCAGSKGGPVCNAGACVQCREDVDCPSGLQRCNGTTFTCYNAYGNFEWSAVEIDPAIVAKTSDGKLQITLADNVNTTVDASGVGCTLEGCALNWTVSCPGQDVKGVFGAVISLTTGKGAAYRIDTTGVTGAMTCTLTLTLTGMVPVPAGSAVAGQGVGALGKPGDVIKHTADVVLLVDTTLMPPDCNQRLANVTVVEVWGLESKYCALMAKNKTNSSLTLNVTAGAALLGIEGFTDPQGVDVTMRIAKVNMTEPMATPCKVCTGKGPSRRCVCTPPARIVGGGATLQILPVATKARNYTVTFEARSTGGTCTGTVQVCVGRRPKGGGAVSCAAAKTSPKCLPSFKLPNQTCDPTVCA